MSTKTVWVTGGAGFLGRAVVKRLIADGHSVHCLVRSGTAARELSDSVPESDRSRLNVIRGALNDLDACRQLVASAPAGLHIASSLSGSAAALFSANVIATRTLLRAVRERACERFVLVSSIAVYGTSHLKAGEILDESSPLDPEPQSRDPYTFSKVAQERVCWEARADAALPLVVVRPGMIYGPGRECLSARVGIKVGPVLIRMGGHQPLPYTYVDNCADALVRAATLTGIDGETFNIIDDELPTGALLIR
ncbi:MAG: NAD(P)-dependent oxidoreductase, partial [Vicinamibacterales bacterium]